CSTCRTGGSCVALLTTGPVSAPIPRPRSDPATLLPPSVAGFLPSIAPCAAPRIPPPTVWAIAPPGIARNGATLPVNWPKADSGGRAFGAGFSAAAGCSGNAASKALASTGDLEALGADLLVRVPALLCLLVVLRGQGLATRLLLWSERAERFGDRLD